jgi:hypothetical protein
MYIDNFVLFVISAVTILAFYSLYQKKINTETENKEMTKEFIVKLLDFYDRDFAFKLWKSQEIVSLSNDIMIKLQYFRDFLINENKGVDLDEWQKRIKLISIDGFMGKELKENFNSISIQINNTDDLVYRKNYIGDILEMMFKYSSNTIYNKWDMFDKPQDIKISVKIVNKEVQNKYESLAIKDNKLQETYFKSIRLVLDINELYCFQIDYHDTFIHNKIDFHCLASKSINNYFNGGKYQVERGYFYNLLKDFSGTVSLSIEPFICYHSYCEYSKSNL